MKSLVVEVRVPRNVFWLEIPVGYPFPPLRSKVNLGGDQYTVTDIVFRTNSTKDKHYTVAAQVPIIYAKLG